MSVYVDEMNICLPSKKWPYKYACHLVADSIEELHKFASRLGLNFTWFQSTSTPHYDLTTRMRRKAVKLGAVEINRKKFIKVMRKYRQRAVE